MHIIDREPKQLASVKELAINTVFRATDGVVYVTTKYAPNPNHIYLVNLKTGDLVESHSLRVSELFPDATVNLRG